MTDAGLDEPGSEVAARRRDVAVNGTSESEITDLPEALPLEADEADAAEQAREVELGDDDYR